MKQILQADWRTNCKSMFRCSVNKQADSLFYLVIVCYGTYEYVSDSKQQKEDDPCLPKETLQYLSAHNSSAARHIKSN